MYNKRSGRSMEVTFPHLKKIMTDRPTNRPTDMKDRGEAELPIINVTISMWKYDGIESHSNPIRFLSF